MDDRPGIVVTGASGRMGRMLLAEIAGSERARLVGAVEAPGHAWIGQDAGCAAGGPPLGVTVTDDALEAIARARAIIDFSAPAATVAFSALAAQARAVHVIGTTGLSEADLERIAAASHHAVMIRDGNMSLGVNLLLGLTRQVAAALGPDWDIEVLEAHHRQKVDGPSGTALMLGEAAAEGRNAALGQITAGPREGHAGPRKAGEIGFAMVRGGDVVGEHDVMFLGDGERLSLRHMATDRRIFARGALAAALWGQGRAPGLYRMADVLGLD